MNLVAVGIGGLLGALLRYGIGQMITADNGFPLGTLCVNLLGCFVLAWFYTATANRWKINPRFRLGIGTGLIGAFTTFSTFSVETLHLLDEHRMLLAAAYVGCSIFGGLLLSYVGVKIAFKENAL